MTYCIHNVTEGYCLDCLRASRDAALARVAQVERERDRTYQDGLNDDEDVVGAACPACATREDAP